MNEGMNNLSDAHDAKDVKGSDANVKESDASEIQDYLGRLE
jgi:hypothetical protein